MRSLGLDPSLTAYGWCVYDSDSAVPSERLVASGHEGTLNSVVPVARFVHFRALVRSLLRRFRVDVVGVESPAYGGGPFSERHFGLMMYSLEAAFEARKDCVLFDPATVKSLATGRGDADKDDMRRAVQIDRVSPDPVQSDEADAYLVGRFAARFTMLRKGLLGPEDLSEPERRLFLVRSRKSRRSASGAPVVKRTAHLFRENSRFFEFSRVPPGSVDLPLRSQIRPELLSWLERL